LLLWGNPCGAATIKKRSRLFKPFPENYCGLTERGRESRRVGPFPCTFNFQYMLSLLNINSASVMGWLESAATQQWIVGILLLLLFICFIKEWMPVEITALAGTAVLMLTGILSTRDVLSSFANSGPLTVVCMFILSASLERTGLIGDLSKLFNKVAKGRELTALLVITLGAFMVSPFVNNTPVVVILMPIVLAFCRDHNIAASKLLIPLSYATILGGTCSVVGTSTNVVVLGQVQKLGYEGIQMFTVTPMGLIYAAAGLLYLWTFGRKWLPSRPTLSTMLPGGIQRDFLLQVRIPADSPHIGATPVSLMQSELLGTKIVEVRRKGFSMQEELQHINLEEGDRILFLCNARKVNQVREARGVDLGWDDSRGLETLEQRDVQIVEGMIANNSEFAGLSLSELKLRQRFNIFVLAIHRQGKNITDMGPDTKLAAGDTLLLEGPQEGMNRILTKQRIIPLSQRPADAHNRSKQGWAILAMGLFIFIGLLGSFEQYGEFFKFFARFNPFYLAFIGALIVVISGCVKPKEAYQAVDWGIIFLILGMLCVGEAMSKTGLAKAIAFGVVDNIGPMGCLVAISGLYLICSILTEMISNNAVAAVMGPLAYEMALQFDANPIPFILAVMFGASASFSTPIGYQTNTYVYNAGGYKFKDFVKVGLPLNILLWIIFTCTVGWLYPLK